MGKWIDIRGKIINMDTVRYLYVDSDALMIRETDGETLCAYDFKSPRASVGLDVLRMFIADYNHSVLRLTDCLDYITKSSDVAVTLGLIDAYCTPMMLSEPEKLSVTFNMTSAIPNQQT